MTDWAAVSHKIEQALALTKTPVAVTFTDSAPSGSAAPAASVPAGCSFWELGANSNLATEASHHRHCAIGIHTHNLAGAPESQQHELETALGAMQGLDYVRPSEVQALPVIHTPHRYVLYGPLSEAASTPDVVLLFARASQGLVVTEALTRVDGEVPSVMGRPACALVPQVVNGGRSVSSLGCCGARAYLDALSDEMALWGLRGDRLEAYAEEIEGLSKANSVLTQFHELRRAAVEAGETPTVEDSLARLQ